MHGRTLAILGLFGVVTAATFLAGAAATRVSAQGSIQVIPVRIGVATKIASTSGRTQRRARNAW